MKRMERRVRMRIFHRAGRDGEEGKEVEEEATDMLRILRARDRRGRGEG